MFYFVFHVMCRISLIFINLYYVLIMTRILSIVVFIYFTYLFYYRVVIYHVIAIIFIVLCSFYFF